MFYFVFLLQTVVGRIHIFICIYSLSYEKAVFVIPGSVSHCFFFILYFEHQNSTMLYPLIYDFYFPVFIVLIFISVIGHVFCGSPDQIAALFFNQVVYIKTAVSLAFKRSFPFDK